MPNNLIGQSDDTNAAGVLGEGFATNAGTGVYGRDRAGKGNGVIGYSDAGRGVWGHTKAGFGVLGESIEGRGVVGSSQEDYGIRGHSAKSAGIRGSSDAGRGVEGWAENSEGVVGISKTGNGVWGQTEGNGVGVVGSSKGGVGVHGKGGRLAGFFEGDLEVTGDIRLANADCAEDFDIAGSADVEPGTVMVINSHGLTACASAYDQRVAGVVSGAGNYKPGIILDKQSSSARRQPIGLLGKVFCKVDAQFGAVEVGDWLTTSPTLGHAMKASEPNAASGSVLGKALSSLADGRGLIPILIALR